MDCGNRILMLIAKYELLIKFEYSRNHNIELCKDIFSEHYLE